jgi:high-affinity iron transporter
VVVGIVPGLIVGLREGVEGALIVGIILAYLTKIGQRALHRYVFIGTGAALAGSVAIAGVLAALRVEFSGIGAKLFEGVAAILAVVVLTSMVLWMMRAAKDIRRHVEQRINLLVDHRQVMGLASLAFIAVFREGVETVLFMAGLTTSIGTDVVLGAAVGLLLAAFLGYGLFAASWKINLRRFFQGTGVFLIIISAGLFAVGLHELQEAGVLPWLSAEVYNLQASFSDGEGNPAGYILRGLVGYNDNPTQLEVAGYTMYWLFAGAMYWGIHTGKIEFVTRPLRRLWRMIRRSPEPSTVEPRAD